MIEKIVLLVLEIQRMNVASSFSSADNKHWCIGHCMFLNFELSMLDRQNKQTVVKILKISSHLCDKMVITFVCVQFSYLYAKM